MKQYSGKLVLLGILLLAGAMGGVAVWYRHSKMRRSLDFWTSDVAQLILRAPNVVLIEIDEPPAQGADQLVLLLDGQAYVTQQQDISKAPGLLHLRQSLLEDHNFDWNDATDDCESKWTHALRFTHDDRQATVLFDLRCKKVRTLERANEASIAPIAPGVERFLAEQE